MSDSACTLAEEFEILAREHDECQAQNDCSACEDFECFSNPKHPEHDMFDPYD